MEAVDMFRNNEVDTKKTAVILGSKSTTHWSGGSQTLTAVLLNGKFRAEFSSVKAPSVSLNETCVFLENGDSDVIGSANLDIEEFLKSFGYAVTYKNKEVTK